MPGSSMATLPRCAFLVRWTLAAALMAGGVGGCNGRGRRNDQGKGSVHGRLAAAAPTTWSAWLPQLVGLSRQGLSLDQVSVDLLGRNQNMSPEEQQQQQPGLPENWPVVETAYPDASGAFAFDDVPAGEYALRLNQPEFADLAYRVDSTEFRLEGGQTITLVLPLVTTITHNLMDPKTPWNAFNDIPPAAALDHVTGEILLTSNLGFAVLDPEQRRMDLLFSKNLFLGREKHQEGGQMPERRVLALAPTTGIAWLLYPDRIMRVDRSLFVDAEASETLDLDALASRVAVGDKFRFRMFPAVENNMQRPWWTGEVYFSPDESILYASTQNVGVMVFDLDQMEVVRVILGQAIGYNPVSNRLFFTNGDYGQHNGTDVLVVDASTFLEVNSAPIVNVRGVAPVPESAETVLIRTQKSTSDVDVPFVVVVDGSGNVIQDERAREYLGLDADPQAGAPSFDLTGQYFMIGSAAFRVLGAGGFEAIPVGVPPGNSFMQRMQCTNKRAVDPANLLEIWYGGNCTRNEERGTRNEDRQKGRSPATPVKPKAKINRGASRTRPLAPRPSALGPFR